MDHRSVGELAKEVGSDDKQKRGHEARRGGVLPSVGFVAGGSDEIVDVLDTNPEVMRTDWLVDEIGTGSRVSR